MEYMYMIFEDTELFVNPGHGPPSRITFVIKHAVLLAA